MTGAGGAEHRSAGIAPPISPPLRGRTYRGFSALTAVLLLLVLIAQFFWLRDTFVTPHLILKDLTGDAYWSAWTIGTYGWIAMDSNGSTWDLRLAESDAAALKKRCGEPLRVWSTRYMRRPIPALIAPAVGENPVRATLQNELDASRPGLGCRIAAAVRADDASRSGRNRSADLHGRTLQVDETYY